MIINKNGLKFIDFLIMNFYCVVINLNIVIYNIKNMVLIKNQEFFI